jgi:hypothetical protein
MEAASSCGLAWEEAPGRKYPLEPNVRGEVAQASTSAWEL